MSVDKHTHECICCVHTWICRDVVLRNMRVLPRAVALFCGALSYTTPSSEHIMYLIHYSLTKTRGDELI